MIQKATIQRTTYRSSIIINEEEEYEVEKVLLYLET